MTRSLALLLAVFLTARCATVVRGRSENIAVTSQPPGASVRLTCANADGGSGITPAVITIPRAAEHCAITFTLAGYSDRTVELQRTRSNVVWLNAIPAFVVGFAFGAATAFGSLLDGTDGNENGAFVAGAIVGGAIPALIDRKSGAIYRHTPQRIDVEMRATPRP